MFESYIIIAIALGSYFSGSITEIGDIKFDPMSVKVLTYVTLFVLALIWPIWIALIGYTQFDLHKKYLRIYFEDVYIIPLRWKLESAKICLNNIKGRFKL